jgi:hypothetical protein
MQITQSSLLNSHNSSNAYPSLFGTIRKSLLVPLLLAPLVGACADAPELPLGRVDLELSAGTATSSYRLSNATFQITGDHELTLSSEQAPTATVVTASLPTGSYSVTLEPGWQLLAQGEDGEAPVKAELSSKNPLPFSIEQGRRTHVEFSFRTGDSPPTAIGDGRLTIGVNVDGAASALIVISEVMRNPQAVTDTAGEWIELFNASTQPFDLVGCTLARDEQSFTFPESVVVPGGGYLAVSNGESPGFKPGALYRGLTLPNSGALALELRCGPQLLDALKLPEEVAATKAGASLSLSPARLDPTDNDDPQSWCAGSDDFNGDQGTPGEPNPSCVAL